MCITGLLDSLAWPRDLSCFRASSRYPSRPCRVLPGSRVRTDPCPHGLRVGLLHFVLVVFGAKIVGGDVSERPKELASKASVVQATVGSNPTVTATEPPEIRGLSPF